MVDKVVSDLVTCVEIELHEVAGASVQTYSEPLIKQKIQTRFDIVFQEQFWERFRTFETVTLDSTTGKPTTALTTITQFDDIEYVYPDKSDIPLKNFPQRINPANIVGTFPRFITYDATKLFRVVPVTSTGNVIVTGRTRPAVFNQRSTVPFDYLTIVYGVCMEIMIDEGSNPGMAQKFQKQYEDRLDQMVDAEPDEIQLNPYRMNFPHTWFTPNEG